MKTFNDADIQAVVEQLTENGATTTNLDIKRELRNQGFWATQDLVSQWMMANYSSLSLDFTDGNGFRTYFEADDSASGIGLQIGVSSGPTDDGVTVCYTKQNGETVESTDDPETGDWKVVAITDPLNDTRTFAYFDAGYTRDEVRQAMANHESVHFHQTRTYTI